MFNLHIYVYWISYQCIVLKFVVIVALNANKCVKRETKRPNIPSKQDHYVAGNSNARERVAHNCIYMSMYFNFGQNRIVITNYYS